MKGSFIFLLVFVGFVSFAQTSDNKVSVNLSGFVSTTAFAQDQEFKFGNGQNAAYVNSNYESGKLIKGFDVRNTRLTLNIKGPDVLKNWKSSAVFEVDLFGGFNGNSTFAASQQYLRIRMAYIDLAKGNFKLRLGQAWSPMFGNPTVSLSHIAFPLGYGSAGFLGWRYPGFQAFYTIAKDSPVNFRIDAAVFSGSWNEPGTSPDFKNAGNLGFPQMELKFNAFWKNSNVYLVGHYDKKDLAAIDKDEKSELDGLALEMGGKTKIGGFMMQGNIYTGKNIGHQFGSITQLPAIKQDLSSYGGWFQLGYDLTQHWSIFGFVGFEHVDKDQALKAFPSPAVPRTRHQLLNFMLKYTAEPVSFGFEFMNSKLTLGDNDQEWTGNQFALSGLYKF